MAHSIELRSNIEGKGKSATIRERERELVMLPDPKKESDCG